MDIAFKQICRLWLVALFGVTMTACDPSSAEDIVIADDGQMLSIGFSVPMAADGNLDSEVGEGYENYVSLTDYRIYFFGVDDKFIARFKPNTITALTRSSEQYYEAEGEIPKELLTVTTDGKKSLIDFQIVVLANWPSYPPDNDMVAGTTTIKNIRNNTSYATFPAKTNFVLGEDNLIPFYGIQEYKGISVSGITTELEEPIYLLRAMAKVEVILETDTYYDLSFSELKIDRYNAKGFCAPNETYENYGAGTEWIENYNIHLINDQNDTEEKSLNFRLEKAWDEGEKRYEKWIAYLPEYKNIDVGNNFSSIKAKLNIQLDDDDPWTIYFAGYENGTTDNSDNKRLNIERNNIYRFHVKCTGYNYKLSLTVSDWEGLYDNTVDFGDGQVVSPVSPYEDEHYNNIEY